MRSAAFRANGNVVFRYSHFPAVLTIVCGYSMPPPKLTGNTPVFNVFHPVKVDLGKPCRCKLNALLPDNVDSRFRKRFHFNKPLFGNDRFYRVMTAITMPDIMMKRLDLYERADRF